jgi:hypothetical protein
MSKRSGRQWIAGTTTAVIAGFSLVLTASGTSAVVPTTGAAGEGATDWIRMASPSGVHPDARLFGVSAATSTRAWAVGAENMAIESVPIVLTLRGRRWSKTALPKITWRGQLRNVSAVTTHDIWAAGADENSTARLLHSNGKTWKEAHLPGSGSGLTIDTMVNSSGHRPWILGRSPDGARLLFHRTATKWVRVALPPSPFTTRTINVDLEGTLLVAGDVPTANNFPTLRLYRYRNRALRHVPTTDPSPAIRASSVLSGPAGLWLGGANWEDEESSAIVHWDGNTWHEADLERPMLGSAGLTADSQGRPAWAIGTSTFIEGTWIPGYLKNVDNHWIRMPNAPGDGTEGGPPRIYAFASVPGTTTSLAVGTVSIEVNDRQEPWIERATRIPAGAPSRALRVIRASTAKPYSSSQVTTRARGRR